MTLWILLFSSPIPKTPFAQKTSVYSYSTPQKQTQTKRRDTRRFALTGPSESDINKNCCGGQNIFSDPAIT
jgi:hypothetical protein